VLVVWFGRSQKGKNYKNLINSIIIIIIIIIQKDVITTEAEKDVSLSHSLLPKIDMIKTTKV
jgi:hypothetical protein